jgi:hypothetical protein
MSPDTIPQISLGTAVLAIFLICCGFVVLRGMARMIAGTVVLALSAWAGFAVWRVAPDLSTAWFGKPLGLVTNGLPALAFLAAFVASRRIARTVTGAFNPSPDHEDAASAPFIRTGFRLLLALAATTVICLIGFTAIHHAGSVEEVRAFSRKHDGSSPDEPASWIQRMKSSVGAWLPESWIRRLDPLAEPGRITLAKLVTAEATAPRAPVIDTRTGEPIPRAIIVRDPELQALAREGKFGALLRHPLISKALNDPGLQAFLKDLKL